MNCLRLIRSNVCVFVRGVRGVNLFSKRLSFFLFLLVFIPTVSFTQITGGGIISTSNGCQVWNLPHAFTGTVFVGDGGGFEVYEWQRSQDPTFLIGPVTTLCPTRNCTDASSLSGTWYYRRKVFRTDIPGDIFYSNVLKVVMMPTVSITGSLTLCQNAASPSLTVTATGGTAPYSVTYSINGAAPVTATTTTGAGTMTGTLSITVPTSTAGVFTYSLTSVVDANSLSEGCTNTNVSSSATITVTALPTATINANTLTACLSGISPVVTITGSGGTAPYTFIYTINGGPNQTITSTAASADLTVPVSSSGNFIYQLVSVQESSTTACINAQTSSLTVVVNPKPVFASIDPLEPTICYGTSFFNVTLTYSNIPTEYKLDWSSLATSHGFTNVGYTTNNFISGSPLTIAVPTATAQITTYSGTLTVRNALTGCESDPGTAQFKINPVPILGTITGVSPVCVGSTLSLSNSLGGGTWTINNANATIGALTGMVTGSAAGSSVVTYSVTNVQGCSSLTTTSVIINALPVLGMITGVSPVCLGSTLNLSNSLTGGIWTINNANATIGSLTGLLTGSAAGTSVVTYSVTNSDGCSNLTTTTVTINALPTVAAITGLNAVCVGSNITLANATGGGVWSLNNANATVNGSGVLTGSTAGTTTVSYAVTDVNNCTTIVTSTKTINALPTVAAITGLNAVCVGSNITLANATNGGVWSMNNANATINGSGVLTGSTAGTTTVSYAVTDVNNCTTIVTSTKTINALPTVAAITGLNAVCVGSNITLANATNGGVWSVNNANATINGSGVLTGSTAGTTTVSYAVTDVNNCTTIVTSTKTINSLPTVAAITGLNAVCVGSNITLANATNGGVWSVNNANATINGSGVLTGSTVGTTTVSYAVTNGNNCTNTVTSIKTINALPVATITPNGSLTFCAGNSVNLTANNAVSYLWSNGATTNTLSNITNSGTFSVTVTDANGCSNTAAPVVVTVHALPTLNITNPIPICSPGTVNLTAAAITTGSSAGLQYSYWTNATASTALTAPSSVGTSGTYYIRAIETVNNCSVIRPVTVAILPQAAMLVNTPAAVCAPNTIDITTAAVTNGSTAGLTYTYFTDALGTVTLNNANAIAQSGTYYIKGTPTTGCSTVVPVQVVINPPPVLVVNNPTAVCAPSLIDLTRNEIIAGSENNLRFNYYIDAALNAEIGNPAQINNSGTYYIRATSNVTGCRSSLPVSVTVNPIPSGQLQTPPVNFICENGTLTLTASGATNYQWLRNGQTIPGATTATYTAATAGTYTVRFTSAQGCTRQASENIVLELLSQPIVDFAVTNTCVGVSASFQNRSQTNNAGGINWLWEFGDGSSSNQFSTQYAYITPGVYQVRLTASNPNCAVNASKTMEYIVRTAARSVRYPDVETLRGVAVTVNARSNIGNQYLWSPVVGVNQPRIASPIITVNETTLYTVSITSDIGCITTDTVLIKIIPGTDIFMPQGFTPNNDGQNDRLFPILVGMRQLSYFKVFNRWGNMIFSTNSATSAEGWNGVYLGVAQPIGAYTWIAEAVDLQGQVVRRTGTVMLLR